MATDLTPDAAESVGTVTKPRRRRRALVAAALGLLALGAAAGIGASRSTGATEGLAVEGLAPAFELSRVGVTGERVRLADFDGQPLVVNFWASWCVPCRKEIPALQAAAARLEGLVGFVGINHLDTGEAASLFEREVGVTYPSGFDPDGAVARDYGVAGLPTTVLVDIEGRIVARRLGEISETELLRLVDEAFGMDASWGTP